MGAARVFLNFRSERHASMPGVAEWLDEQLWRRAAFQSAVTTGKYSGPVFERQVESGTLELMGSNCEEGTYFVFVQVLGEAPDTAADSHRESSPSLLSQKASCRQFVHKLFQESLTR